MALKLSLPGGRGAKTLVTGTLSIGRGESNDWVLPDPDRHLSKTHCVISVENGRYVLTDLSTNGVYINGARQPTTRDSRTVLTDGDEFRLGEYDITVAEVAAPVQAQTPARPPAADDDPLNVDPLEDPLGLPVGRTPDPAFSHPVRHAAPVQRMVDPFDEADHAARRGGGAWLDDDFAPKPDIGPAQPDNVDAVHHAMPVPRVLPPPVNPNEIDFDALIGDLSDLHPPSAPAAPPPPARQTPRRPLAPHALPDPFADLDDLAPPPAPPRPAPPAPPLSTPELPDPFAEPEESAAKAPSSLTPAPPPPPARTAAAPGGQQPPPSADAMQAALRAFLEGAGLPNATVGSDPEATLRLVGQVFRIMTEGLREVLMSRAAIKGEMRVEQTMIRAANNNPLKFAMTPEDAVQALLIASRPGYMTPLAATREAFDDIKTHELAVMAGVQTALVGLLRRFDPETLESRLTQGKLAAALPGARKSRLWDSFRDTYKAIASEAEDDFQAVFGRAFAKAYMAQSRKE